MDRLDIEYPGWTTGHYRRVTCRRCGKPFDARPGEGPLRYYLRLYCSRTCYFGKSEGEKEEITFENRFGKTGKSE